MSYSLSLQVVADSISRRNQSVDKPNEDAYFVDVAARAFSVVDGVTRSRDQSGRYPDPSPAKKAADLVVATASKVLNVVPRNCPESLLRFAFRSANEAIRGYAADLPKNDYLFNDYPGAVTTMLLIDGDFATYAHIGDCILLHIDEDGRVTRLTEEQTAKAQDWVLSSSVPLSDLERYRKLRMRCRNIKDSPYCFGVLTGEPIAETFVTVGRRQLSPGDVLILLSDGFGPFLELPPERGSVILRPDALQDLWTGDLRSLADKTEKVEVDMHKRSDDKTAIHIKLGQLA
jgi:serine/threonine protein phosphatase PrpC